MATVLKNQDVEMTIRCRAFSGEGVRENKILVEPGKNGRVLAWDAVAGHYTACHSIAARTQARIKSRVINFWAFDHFYG